MADPDVAWETCAQDGCVGSCLPTGGWCWAHASDADLDQALKRLAEDGRLDARGVPVTARLLARLLAAAPHNDDGSPVLTDARFEQATFHGDAWFHQTTFQGDAGFKEVTFQGDGGFEEVTFQGDAGFDLATFRGGALFQEATFQGEASFVETTTFQGVARFDLATFHGDAWFARATFQGDAWFKEATFQGDARFEEATIQGAAVFGGVAFEGYATFGGVTFEGDTWFGEAAFQRDAWFSKAAFQDDARFEKATFKRAARFDLATFQHAQQLGPMLVHKCLVLDQAVFHERAQIEASAAAVCCQRARFLAGVQLRLRWAQVVLDDADLAAPSLLTGVPAFADLEEGRWARALGRLLPQAPPIQPRVRWRPRLVSLRRADVAGLTLADVDLRGCRFAGAHHLDQLRLEQTFFGYTPRSWRWTTRTAIAEERYLRAHPHQRGPKGSDDRAAAAGAGGSGTAGRSEEWYGPADRPPVWLEVEPASPRQTAMVYRALRKGREDSKDEPGAADFYYGEMEMRRLAKRVDAKAERRARHVGHWAATATEHAVLWLYWAVSGYGLRAWRALATLAILVVLAGGAFAFWGFAPPNQPAVHPVAVDARGAPIYAVQPVERPGGLDELPTGVRFSAQAATALLRGPDRQLTALGEWLHLALRLTGPVLLGLAVLSIRGRVKR